VALIIRSLGPALAAGNTVAARLPGQTALTNALVADVVSKVPSLGARLHSPLLAASVTTFAGQNCMAGSRILVHADQVRERLEERLTHLVVGPGDEKSTDMGPMIDSAVVARVDRIVEDSASLAKQSSAADPSPMDR
jgi:acyl-CoA reductase-like NAD-dependent aldehyde dehydrogenase